MEFEKAEERFPTRVADSRGYGCDILSFGTQEQANDFERSRDARLVVRCIEVKGSSAPSGDINLADKQLARAQEFQERFYLYRVFEVSPGDLS